MASDKNPWWRKWGLPPWANDVAVVLMKDAAVILMFIAIGYILGGVWKVVAS